MAAKHYNRVALACALATTALGGEVVAGSITEWNTSNVVVGPPVTGEEAGASVVYDRVLPDPAAQTNGQIFYQAPEADAPGLRVSNTAYTTGQGSFEGCVLASSTAECNSPFQSGKRFKQQFLDDGSIDLVFDVEDSDNGESVYQVFQRAVNLTGSKLEGLRVELGFGVGEDFMSAGPSGGVSFSQTVQLGPNNLPAFTQFPFGLFGDDQQPNPNPVFTLDGFFDGDSRAGFDLDVTPALLESTGMYGSYDDLFETWLSREMVPDGLLWDWALGAADPLVMAWDNGSEWEVRRAIDDSLDGLIGTITVNDVYALDEPDWQFFDYGDIAGVEGFLSVPVFEDAIEDLANLNINYAIVVADDVDFDTFTLRTTVAASAGPTATPVPFTGALLASGLGLLAVLRRRRKT